MNGLGGGCARAHGASCACSPRGRRPSAAARQRPAGQRPAAAGQDRQGAAGGGEPGNPCPARAKKTFAVSAVDLPAAAAGAQIVPLLDAARHARVVTFDYLKAGEHDPDRRTVQPWGVLSWRRRWYVVGHDLDRGEARSFRLSRVVGAVDVTGPPDAFQRPDVDLLGYVASRGPDPAGSPGRGVRPGLGKLDESLRAKRTEF